jgi:DNA polymerase
MMALANHAKDYLEYMASLGVRDLPVVTVEPTTVATAKAETLEDITTDLGDCHRCPLGRHRTNLVFGEGPPNAKLMFVGEGPGRDEDLQGRPFVGPSGQLLTDIIVKGMQMRREDCYIANIVKCRPPDNRNPEPEEARTCLPFLKRQITVIKPRAIVALGLIASQYLLDTDLTLGRLRNRFHDLSGTPVMPTYHPSALLRNPGWKRDTWEDIKLVMALMKNQE